MTVSLSDSKTYPGHDYSLSQLLHAVKRKLHDVTFNGRATTTMNQIEVNTIESDASEVLSLARTLKNSFAPINRIPLEILSLIPDHCTEGDVGQALIALTHVCRGWREVFTSRPSLWTTLDLRNAEKTRTYLQRSKSSPLGIVLCEYEGGDEGYLDDSFSLVIPHISRLKSLELHTIVFPHFLKNFRCHAPFLERLMIHTVFRHPDLESILFDCGLPSLRELSIGNGFIPLPWKNMANLRVFEFSHCTGCDITQLLDLFESSPLLQTVKLLDSIPSSSNAPPERLVLLPHLNHLVIHASGSHSVLLNHLRIPIGVSMSQSFHFDVDESPLLDYLPEASTNLMNVSHVTTIDLRFDWKQKLVQLSGPSGSLRVSVHWDDTGTTPPYTMDRWILQSLSMSISSTAHELSISRYVHPILAGIDKCPVFRTLSSMENIRTLTLDECYNQPFVLALNPEDNPSRLVLCPNLEGLILRVKFWDQIYTKHLVRMAESRASRGVGISSIMITGPDRLVTGELSELREYVNRVEYSVDDTKPAWPVHSCWCR